MFVLHCCKFMPYSRLSKRYIVSIPLNPEICSLSDIRCHCQIAERSVIIPIYIFALLSSSSLSPWCTHWPPRWGSIPITTRDTMPSCLCICNKVQPFLQVSGDEILLDPLNWQICPVEVPLQTETFPSGQKISTGQIHQVKGSKRISSTETWWKSTFSNFIAWSPHLLVIGLSTKHKSCEAI